MEPLPQAAPLQLWSVTTLIGMGLGTGPGLINWIVNQVATAGVDKRGTVDAMLRDGDREGAIKWLADQRWKKSEKAKVRGTDIHKALEEIALGAEPRVEPQIAPFVEQGRRWIEKFRPTFLLAEAPVYNIERRYAGTLDGIIELGGYRLLVDYKTTEHPPGGEKARPPWPETALQLCAYSRCTEVGVIAEQRYSNRGRYYLYDQSQTHEELPKVDGALCIVISPFDFLAVPVAIDDRVWRAFLHVQQAARWQSEVSRHVFGAPLELPTTNEEEA